MPPSAAARPRSRIKFRRPTPDDGDSSSRRCSVSDPSLSKVTAQPKLSGIGRPRVLLIVRPLTVACLLLLSGCCTEICTSVRNETGKDVNLTLLRNAKEVETVMIRARSAAECGGIMPPLPGTPPDSWIVRDEHARFTFEDVSPIASMPGAFVSSSRFTSIFPCKRVTRHVALTGDMTIQAERVVGYTKSQPEPFPIHYTNREDVK
jgi:hypothetical protein